MKFYVTGHKNLGNRGTEALVRSNLGLLKSEFGDVEFLVPSDDVERDLRQWPNASEQGVRFVSFYYPKLTRYWVQLQRLPIRFLKRFKWPFPATKSLLEDLNSVDAVLSIGGDMYTYEGRLPAWIMGLDQIAMDLGKPVILWGASVGPFTAEPDFAVVLKNHLSRMKLIAVREEDSERYLKEDLNLTNVIRMPDPAFNLEKEHLELNHFLPKDKGDGVLGLNISPLVERLTDTGGIRDEVVRFIRRVVLDKNLSVLLIPHVIPLTGEAANNDALYMKQMLESLGDLKHRVTIADSHLNAIQLKYVISQCRYFIGARTHATIAAFSSAVPTISIAYSRKAHGINRDIFGDTRYVVDMNEISEPLLYERLCYLERDEVAIRQHLAEKVASMKEISLSAAKTLRESLLK